MAVLLNFAMDSQFMKIENMADAAMDSQLMYIKNMADDSLIPLVFNSS